MKKQTAKILALLILFFLPSVVLALMSVEQRGTWPANWPKELEPFRSQARTIGVASGTQEDIYEICFMNRADFERIWPVILQFKTPSAPLTLRSTGQSSTPWLNNQPTMPSTNPFSSGGKPTVRIHAPCCSGGPMYPSALARSNNKHLSNEQIGKLLKAGKLKTLRPEPPWPAEVISTNGELPEYVVAKEENGIMTWVPSDSFKERKSFFYRARVDIELVVDGKIVDLNSIPLPTNTPIHDERFKQ